MLFLPLFSFAQQYSAVVDIPNKTAVQSYRTAKDWFAVTFNSSNDVIQLDDSIQKKIIAKGIKKVYYPVRKIIVTVDEYFTLIVQFKDGKYKYDVNISEVKTLGGQSYTYSELQEMGTEEGIRAYNKRMGTSWAMGKKLIQQSIDTNKLMLAEIDKQLYVMIDNLTSTLKKEDKTNNW